MTNLKHPSIEPEEEQPEYRKYRWWLDIFDLPSFIAARMGEHREARQDAEFKASLPNVTGVTIDSHKELGILNRKLRKCEADAKSKKNASRALILAGGCLSGTIVGAVFGVPMLAAGYILKKMSDSDVKDGQKLNEENAEVLERNATIMVPFEEPSSFLSPKRKPELSSAIVGAMPEGVGLLDKKLRRCENIVADRNTQRDALLTMALASAVCLSPMAILFGLAALAVNVSAGEARNEAKKLTKDNDALMKESSLSGYEEPESKIAFIARDLLDDLLPAIMKPPKSPSTPKR